MKPLVIIKQDPVLSVLFDAETARDKFFQKRADNIFLKAESERCALVSDIEKSRNQYWDAVRLRLKDLGLSHYEHFKMEDGVLYTFECPSEFQRKDQRRIDSLLSAVKRALGIKV